MVAFKTHLAVAACLLCTGAVAADLLPPPPPPAPVEVGGGWYLRADFTEASYGRPHDDSRGALYDSGAAPLVGLRLSDAVGYGGGVGYRVNEWLRVDATVDQREPARFRAQSSQSNFAAGYDVEAARVSGLTGFVNVYADIGTWWGFTPYVGGGVGFSNMGMSRGSRQTTCMVEACDGVAGIGTRDAVARPSRSVASFAWALTGGVSYAIGGGFSLDAAYRYVDFGNARSGLDATNSGTRLKDIAANEFRLGLRYDLGSGFGGERGGLPNLIGVGDNAYGN